MNGVEFVSELPEGPQLRRMSEAIAFYSAVAEDLKRRPGEWALIRRKFANKDSLKSTVTNINGGRMASLPNKEFRAAARDGQLYLKYIGESGA